MASDAILATAILAGMCLLMWFLARLAKKRMGIGSGVITPNSLRIVGKRPLDQKSSLWVIEIAGGRHILVGSSEGGVAKIDDISSEEYALMLDGDVEAAATRRPRLRVAKDTKPASTDTDTPDDDEAEQRFATVGETFTNLLGKARDARTNRKASGE